MFTAYFISKIRLCYERLRITTDNQNAD
jgi:hypothetical protein